MVDATIVRQTIEQPAEKGAERNTIGRWRGAFSTKINARSNAGGLPIGLVFTPGQVHDVIAFPALMHEVDRDPEQLLGDKGYHADAVGRQIVDRGAKATRAMVAHVGWLRIASLAESIVFQDGKDRSV